MHVIADVDVDPVVVDGISDRPVEGSGAVVTLVTTRRSRPLDTSMYFFGYRHADQHAVGFVVHVVFAGPPHAGAQSLAGGGNEPALC